MNQSHADSNRTSILLTRTWEFCKLTCEGHLLIVELNRPEVLNALHRPANLELASVFDAFASDPELWVAIVTGRGRAFCAGNDLKYFASSCDNSLPPTGFGGLTARFDLLKPVIAAVNGLALGGGFELALACDILIADEGAKFALPEPRVGLAATAGGLLRLPRQIHLKQAMGLILTGRQVSAATGAAMGFVNETAPADQALDVARQWAKDVLACSPAAIRASKHVAMRSNFGADCQLEYASQKQQEPLQRLYRSHDVVEGPKAFAEKRPPVWETPA